MASPEIIGLLCAGATNYHSVGKSGDATNLSRAELAGLLSGISRDAMNLAMAKYACDVSAERLLIANVRVWAAGVAVNEGWQIKCGRPTVVNLAAIAVFEVVRPNCCKRCHGVGYLGSNHCRSCNGIGYKHLSGKQIADAAMIDHCNYYRTWKDRYALFLEYVYQLEQTVTNALRVADKVAVNN